MVLIDLKIKLWLSLFALIFGNYLTKKHFFQTQIANRKSKIQNLKSKLQIKNYICQQRNKEIQSYVCPNKIQNKKMNNSIETQQNAFSQQEHIKIADIYQKMLQGDKSALSSLQKVKIHSPKQFNSKKVKPNQNHDDQLKLIAPTYTIRQGRKSISGTSPQKQQDYRLSESKVINEEPSEQLTPKSKQNQYDKQKQKFRSYIKKKVNELRNQKQFLKFKQQNQISQIKKIQEKAKTANQSKSFELIKKKQVFNKNNKNQSITKNGKGETSPLMQQVKKSTQKGHNLQKLKKAQSESQHPAAKLLPPIKQKKKLPTENSQSSSRVIDSNISRKQIGTPINLANSNIQVEIKANSKSQNSISSKMKQSKMATNEIKMTKKQKPQQSRAKKISLPEMRKQREEFANINQDQKRVQLDILQYHQQTRNFVDQTRVKYQLNFKNQSRLIQLKKQNSIQPVLNVPSSRKNIQNKEKSSIESPQKQQKKMSQIIQEKVNQIYKDIQVIEEQIEKKKNQLNKISERLGKNLLNQYWLEHDLQNSVFEDDFEEDFPNEDQIKSPSNLTESSINQAYSTAMPSAKDKKSRWRIIKQYDTNRSFQQYAKSRSTVKPIPVEHRQNSLNKIQQGDELEQSMQNKVTVNSRLKKLLLQ